MTLRPLLLDLGAERRGDLTADGQGHRNDDEPHEEQHPPGRELDPVTAPPERRALRQEQADRPGHRSRRAHGRRLLRSCCCPVERGQRTAAPARAPGPPPTAVGPPPEGPPAGPWALINRRSRGASWPPNPAAARGRRGRSSRWRWTWRAGSSAIDHRLPLPVRPADDRAVAAGRGDADRVGAHRRRALPADDEVLGQAVPDQLRHGRGHRDRAGVPVRDELERLQPLRRRHLRRPAGDRGAARVLPRVDVPRPVDLRLGPAAEAGAPGLASGWPRSAPCSRRTSSWPRTPGCSTRSAPWSTPPAGRAELHRLRRGAHQLHGRRRVHPHDHRVLRHRRHVRARHLRVAPGAAARAHRGLPAVAAAWRW